jgi:hypothetical protein
MMECQSEGTHDTLPHFDRSLSLPPARPPPAPLQLPMMECQSEGTHDTLPHYDRSLSLPPARPPPAPLQLPMMECQSEGTHDALPGSAMSSHLRLIRPSDTVYLGFAQRMAGTRSRLLHAIHVCSPSSARVINCITAAAGVDVNSPRHRLPPPPHLPSPDAFWHTSPLLFAVEMRIAALADERASDGRTRPSGLDRGCMRMGPVLL